MGALARARRALHAFEAAAAPKVSSSKRTRADRDDSGDDGRDEDRPQADTSTNADIAAIRECCEAPRRKTAAAPA